MKDKSKLGNLPANQQATLEQWLFDDSPALEYEAARSRLWQDFSVRTSVRALCEWRQKRAQERSLAKIAASSQASRAVRQKFSENPSEAFEALMDLIGQAAFEMRMEGEKLSMETIKDLAELAALGLKSKTEAKKIELDERNTVVKERADMRESCELFIKWEADQRAKEIAGSNATNAEKIEQLGSLMFKELWKS